MAERPEVGAAAESRSEPRVWVHAGASSAQAGWTEVESTAPIVVGDLVVEVAIGPPLRPHAIYRVRSVKAGRVTCERELMLPVADPYRLERFQSDFQQIANLTSEKPTIEVRKPAWLAYAVSALFPYDDDVLRDLRRLFGDPAPSVQSAPASRPRTVPRRRVWIHSRSTAGDAPVTLEVVGSPEILKGDLVIELATEPQIRPLGIYEVMRGRRTNDVDASRSSSTTAACELEVRFPSLQPGQLAPYQSELKTIANSTSQRDTRNLNIHALLVQTLARMYETYPETVDSVKRILGDAEQPSPRAPEQQQPPERQPPPEQEQVLNAPATSSSAPARQLWIHSSDDQGPPPVQIVVPSATSDASPRAPFSRGDLVVQLSTEPEPRFVGIYEVVDESSEIDSERSATYSGVCRIRLGLAAGKETTLPTDVREVARLTRDFAQALDDISQGPIFRNQFITAVLRASAGDEDLVREIRAIVGDTRQPPPIDRENLRPIAQRPQQQAEQRPPQQPEQLQQPEPKQPTVAEAHAPSNARVDTAGVTPATAPSNTENAAPNRESPTPINVIVNPGIAQGPVDGANAFWIEIVGNRLTTRWEDKPTSTGTVSELAKLAFVSDPGPALYAAILESQKLLDQAGTPTSFDAAFAKARDRARRVLLNVPSDLQLLPWEAMAGELAQFGIDEKLPLARWVLGRDCEPAPQPLRIVFAVANPKGLGQPESGLLGRLSPIDRDAEIARCRAAVQPLVDGGATFDVVPATRGDLIAAMASGPHVLHLIAHGVWNNAKGDYGVVLEKNDGTHDICYLGAREDTNSVLSMLSAGTELRLVVLGCCYSGAFAKIGDAVKVSLGARLAEVVPTVVAMQDMITPEAVGYFARGFYAGLARTGETDRAAAIGRLMMRHQLPAVDRQWTLPAVFVGTTRPRVFDPDAASRAAGEAVSAAMTRSAAERVRPDDPVAAAARGAGASLPVGDAIAAAMRAAIMQLGVGVAAPRPANPAQDAIRQARDALADVIARPVALSPEPVLARVGPRGTDLVLPASVAHQTIAALNSGKHVIFIGPPGTGKTTLTTCLTELAERSKFTAGTIAATASADWSTAETVGALLPAKDGVAFRPGLVLDAILEGKWLVIDEINRAEIDKAFGELFTILSGQPITIPFGRDAKRARVLPPHKSWRASVPPANARWTAAAWTPADAMADDIVVHPNFRILASMNVYDRSFLFSMSLAFMRRFAFIDVDLPENYADLVTQWLTPDHPRKLLVVDEATRAEIKATLLALIARDVPSACAMLQKHRALGPAILADVLRYVEQRRAVDGDWQTALGEAVALYVVPQLDGLAPDVVEAIEQELAKVLPKPAHRTGPSLVCARLRALYPHVFA